MGKLAVAAKSNYRHCFIRDSGCSVTGGCTLVMEEFAEAANETKRQIWGMVNKKRTEERAAKKKAEEMVKKQHRRRKN